MSAPSRFSSCGRDGTGKLAHLALIALLVVIFPQGGAQAGDGGKGPPGCPPGLAKKENGCQPPGQAKNRVLRVGTFRGIAGQFSTIQSAVDAANPGDWILVAPGDYHEQGDREHLWPGVASGAVYITTPNLHLRGMDRNGVVVDGTKPGAAQCSSDPNDQDLGPVDWNGTPLGRNGILVFKADNVVVENLTACNFLDGSGGGGNQIWWNGGYESGKIGLGPYLGQYLSATSTYFQSAQQPNAEYGIFVSNSRGPGMILHSYASNMADASFYIGACPDCNAVLADAHAQNSAQGFSGTNSGGHLVVAYSEWDGNLNGISANSQDTEGPSPQNGQCPADEGLTGNGLCTYYIRNYVHDNNNPNVPGAGLAGMGPVGTGILVSGGQYDTVAWNRVEHNGSWGILLVPFADFSQPPPPNASCAGGIVPQVTDPFPLGLLASLGCSCYFDAFGNEVHDNFLRDNGFFGNDTNGDLGEISGLNDPGNCWYENFDPQGVTSSPADIQTTHAVCGVPNQGANFLDPLGLQLACATQALGGPCTGLPGNPGYPQPTQVTLLPLPLQSSMEDPCEGVPSNPWCKKERGEKPW
jgi:hypothetical protein